MIMVLPGSSSSNSSMQIKSYLENKRIASAKPRAPIRLVYAKKLPKSFLPLKDM